MAKTYHMSATARDKGGKGSARAARRNGQVPAVIYGNKQDPLSINLEMRELRRHLAATFFTHVYSIKVGNDAHKVIPREVQFHPVTDEPMHVDFLRVSDKTKISVSVPVEVLNVETSPGVKAGGLLNIVYHELEVKCLADAIPEHITVDVGKLGLGQSVHLNEIKLPKGVEATLSDDNATIVTIATPSALKGKEEELTGAPTPSDVPTTKQKEEKKG